MRCCLKFYFNSFFLINANLFYQGNNNTALQMVDILTYTSKMFAGTGQRK